MDTRTATIRRPVRARPVVVLELDDDDFELVEELPSWHGRRYPPAISDRELSRLVDECTAELCDFDRLHGGYGYALS